MADEEKVLTKVKNLLKNTPYCLGLRITNTTGVPDMIACVDGHFLGIEVKDDMHGNYQLTKAQKMRLRHIADAGGCACVVDKSNIAAFETYLDILSNPTVKCTPPRYWGYPTEEDKR